MVERSLYITVRHEQGIIGTHLQLRQATPCCKLHTLRCAEVTATPPAINHEPQVAILFPNKKHAHKLCGLLLHKLTNSALLQTAQEGTPLATLENCWVSVCSCQTKLLQASFRSKTWHRLCLAERFNEISTTGDPQPIEWGRDTPSDGSATSDSL